MSSQGWDPGPFRHLVEDFNLYLESVLPFALCFLLFLQNLFQLPGLWLEETEGSPPAHTAERSHHPFSSPPLAAPQGPLRQLHSHWQLCCTEKEGLSPLMFPFFSFFLHTSTTPSRKVLSLSSSACQVLWWTYSIDKVAEKYSVLQGRIFCHLSE